MPLLIRFAIPLMLGDLFQQLYGATDSVIVGKYGGDFALASVASSTYLLRMILGLFTGISAGASVIILNVKELVKKIN
ncbi:MAG: MATE family efflux transporter [Clostridiales bacterium]|nr:MATE family efflux transporter [Clostridiales bacterium]